MVAPGRPVDLAAGATIDDHVLDRRAVLEGFVRIGLERHLAPAAHALVRGDQQVRVAILDAAGQGVGREAPEDHRMDGPDARAGEHGDRRLGDHRHVDGDDVALLGAELLQHVGEAADFGVKLPIGDVPALFRVVALPQDRGLVAPRLQVAVEAVMGGVELAVVIPADMDVAGEAAVLHLGEGCEPVQSLALLPPEALGVVERLLIELAIAGVVDPRLLRPGRGNGDELSVHGISSGDCWFR